MRPAHRLNVADADRERIPEVLFGLIEPMPAGLDDREEIVFTLAISADILGAVLVMLVRTRGLDKARGYLAAFEGEVADALAHVVRPGERPLRFATDLAHAQPLTAADCAAVAGGHPLPTETQRTRALELFAQAKARAATLLRPAAAGAAPPATLDRAVLAAASLLATVLASVAHIGTGPDAPAAFLRTWTATADVALSKLDAHTARPLRLSARVTASPA